MNPGKDYIMVCIHGPMDRIYGNTKADQAKENGRYK